MMINRFSDKQILVLQALAKYKFLTYSQMLRLGIDNHKPNLSTLLRSLRDCSVPYTRKIPHRLGVEAKHYLTQKGMEILVELCGLSEEEIQFPKGVIHTDTQDQKHRTSIIDIQIEMDLAAQSQSIRTVFCDRYFDTTGNNRVDRNLKSKTAIVYEGKSTLKADMVFLLETGSQQELYLLELENGKDAKKAVPKCIMHGKAILMGSANEKYDFSRGYRTLWVFEHRSIMESVLQRLNELEFFKDLKEYFLFKPLEEIGQDFFQGWTNLAGKERKMYY